jgi:hypothetical protein
MVVTILKVCKDCHGIINRGLGRDEENRIPYKGYERLISKDIRILRTGREKKSPVNI